MPAGALRPHLAWPWLSAPWEPSSRLTCWHVMREGSQQPRLRGKPTDQGTRAGEAPVGPGRAAHGQFRASRQRVAPAGDLAVTGRVLVVASGGGVFPASAEPGGGQPSHPSRPSGRGRAAGEAGRCDIDPIPHPRHFLNEAAGGTRCLMFLSQCPSRGDRGSGPRCAGDTFPRLLPSQRQQPPDAYSEGAGQSAL